MARPLSEEELQLKKRARRRLIGAILLVTVVAVVLPMVLDTEPRSTSQEITIQIPSPDSKGFTSKVVPVLPSAKKSPVPEAKSEKADKSEKTDKTEKVEKAVAEATKPAAPPAAEKPAPKPKPAPAAPAGAHAAAKADAAVKPGAGTFFIQVTALADADKVTQVRQRMTEAGIQSYTEAVNVAKGKVTRVRAGPFKTRDEAEQARVKLEQLGFEGKVAAN